MSSPHPIKTNSLLIDCLIFDLDGTLVDTKKDIADSANKALVDLGLNTVPDEVVHSFVGKGISNLMEGCLGVERASEVDEAVRLFRQHYKENLTTFSHLYPGVSDVLSHFASKKKAVLTNKIESFSTLILEDLNVMKHFEVVWGGDTGPEMKPDPLGIETVLNRLNVSKEKTILIGDSTVDIQTGKNAGVKTCAVTYGFDSKETLQKAQPDYVIDSMKEVMDLFL